MSTFNKKATRAKSTSPVTTTGTTLTATGGAGFTRSTFSDLYLLSVSNMVGADTFHEKADPRNERYIDLLREAAHTDRRQVLAMLPWLRTEGYMRAAAVLGAAEVAKTLCDAGNSEGVADMIDGALQRADEPGEFLAYWETLFSNEKQAGRSWTRKYRAVKEGLGRAVQRLYTEFSYGKWDSTRREFTFAKVIQTVHPTPVDQHQSDLFKVILERNRGKKPSVERLPMLSAVAEWRKIAARNPRDSRLLNTAFLKEAGLTEGDVLSELGSNVDRNVLWDALIPITSTGALLKNLKNFDEAGISQKSVAYVTRVLSDPEAVRKARLFPFRFLSAYRYAPSLRWGAALEAGLDASLVNVPALKGRTLILVDRSPSMFPGRTFSTPNKSDITLADQAALFGAALAVKAESADLVEFGGTLDNSVYRSQGPGSRRVGVRKGASPLRVVDEFGESISGTDIPLAVKQNLVREHDRLVIITDEQSRSGWLPSNMGSYGGSSDTRIDDLVPAKVPVYMWNMAGYSSSILETGGSNRHVFGGLSDSSFRMIQQLEDRRSATWPWNAPEGKVG